MKNFGKSVLSVLAAVFAIGTVFAFNNLESGAEIWRVNTAGNMEDVTVQCTLAIQDKLCQAEFPSQTVGGVYFTDQFRSTPIQPTNVYLAP